MISREDLRQLRDGLDREGRRAVFGVLEWRYWLDGLLTWALRRSGR